MPKYIVELTQDVVEGLTLIVEADNEEKAEELALELSLEREWDFIEVSERDVISIEEIKDNDA